MGVEHSSGPRDFTDPEETWKLYGFRVKWTSPPVPARSKHRMLEELTLSMMVECKKPVPLGLLSAYCWSNVYHKGNPEGIFHLIPLPYVEGSRAWDDWGVTTYKFSTSFIPTHHVESRITFYVKLGNIIQWANRPEVDHVMDIQQPKDINAFTKTVSHDMITKRIGAGNYQAVRKAGELGYDVVLRFSDKIPKKGKYEGKEVPQVFINFNKDGGAGSEIPADRIQEAVEWLSGKESEEYTKVLVADEYGMGRVGSALTSYVFSHNPHLSFEEAYRFVQQRRQIYCHKGLKDTLETMYPRE